MRVLVWGNQYGVRSSIDAVRSDTICGFVVAANRPGEHEPVAAMARELESPLLVHPFRRDTSSVEAFLTEVRGLQPDLFLLNSYSMVLPADWLRIPPQGAINVHGGLLPEYRGAHVLNWVLVNGETETGVTIHEVDEGVDTGPILGREVVGIAGDDTAVTLRDKLVKRGTQMLATVMSDLHGARRNARPQDERAARTWPRRRPEDGMIDWRWPAPRIYNLVRALVAPWPGARWLDERGECHTIRTFTTLAEIEQMRKDVLSRS